MFPSLLARCRMTTLKLGKKGAWWFSGTQKGVMMHQNQSDGWVQETLASYVRPTNKWDISEAKKKGKRDTVRRTRRDILLQKLKLEKKHNSRCAIARKQNRINSDFDKLTLQTNDWQKASIKEYIVIRSERVPIIKGAQQEQIRKQGMKFSQL